MTALRLIYNFWLTPWDLLGDEAYYWLQARHLDINYAEKGPLLAWMIAVCCKAFGDVEWAVRLPAVLSAAAAAWGVGRLGIALARGDQRVGFLAVLVYFLLPANTANAQICTQDGPMTVLWIALTAVSLRIFRLWRAGNATWGEWMLFWALMGVGVLLKQSIFIFLGGMGVYWLISRKELPLKGVWFAQQAAGVVVLLAICSPMILWDSRHGWLMVSHTLGHLGAGGDQTGKIFKGNFLNWEANTIGSFIGIFGPAGVILMVWSWVWACKTRREDPSLWRDQLWLILASWFATFFFIALSLRKPIVPSWPLPNMAPMCAVVAHFLVSVAPPFRAVSALPASGQKPRANPHLRRVFAFTLIYGIAAIILLAFPTFLGKLPKYGPKIQEKVLDQVMSNKPAAAKLQDVIDQVTAPDGAPPLIVVRHYQTAALMSFYLRGNPDVSSSGRYIDKRPSNFDHWPGTNLENPAHFGKRMVLDSEDRFVWDDVLFFDTKREAGNGQHWIAENYRGVKPAYLERAGRR